MIQFDTSYTNSGRTSMRSMIPLDKQNISVTYQLTSDLEWLSSQDIIVSEGMTSHALRNFPERSAYFHVLSKRLLHHFPRLKQHLLVRVNAIGEESFVLLIDDHHVDIQRFGEVVQWSSIPFNRLQQTSDTLESFKVLPQGWNGYSAQRIGSKAIQSANRFLGSILERFWIDSQELIFPDDIIPIPNGNIQFEWSRQNWELEIEILASGTFSYLSVEKSENNEVTQEEDKLFLKEILAKIGEFVVLH